MNHINHENPHFYLHMICDVRNNNFYMYIFLEVNEEMLNILKYVRPGGGFVPKFPVFAKVEVNGLNEEPLFTYLKVLSILEMI